MSEIIAPVKNARYTQIKILGKPKISPKSKDNLVSPRPIPFPLVKTVIIKKRIKVKTADKILLIGF